MKKVNFNLMNKGGVGKTAYSIFTLIKLKNQGREEFKMVDMDTNNHSLANRFKGSEYEKNISEVSLLAGGELSNMDYSKLQDFFDSIAKSNNKEFYCDLGQDDSKAFQKLVRSIGADALNEYLLELDIDLTIVPIIKVDDLDSVNYFIQYVELLKGQIKISAAANMLGVSTNHPNKKTLMAYCGENGVELNFFNTIDIADGFKVKIHEHLVSGLNAPLGLAKGNLNKVLDEITIP